MPVALLNEAKTSIDANIYGYLKSIVKTTFSCVVIRARKADDEKRFTRYIVRLADILHRLQYSR